MCSNETQWAMITFHLKPTQPVEWCGTGHEESNQRFTPTPDAVVNQSLKLQ